jgi:hypothetical protein
MQKLNERIAVWGTKLFGSMWVFYIFFIWGLLGLIPSLSEHLRNIILLISSAWIQLWALPLIAVGNNVLSRTSEKRANEDHRLIKENFNLMMKEIMINRENNKEIHRLLKLLHEKLSDETR